MFLNSLKDRIAKPKTLNALEVIISPCDIAGKFLGRQIVNKVCLICIHKYFVVVLSLCLSFAKKFFYLT